MNRWTLGLMASCTHELRHMRTLGSLRHSHSETLEQPDSWILMVDKLITVLFNEGDFDYQVLLDSVEM